MNELSLLTCGFGAQFLVSSVLIGDCNHNCVSWRQSIIHLQLSLCSLNRLEALRAFNLVKSLAPIVVVPDVDIVPVLRLSWLLMWILYVMRVLLRVDECILHWLLTIRIFQTRLRRHHHLSILKIYYIAIFLLRLLFIIHAILIESIGVAGIWDKQIAAIAVIATCVLDNLRATYLLIHHHKAAWWCVV